MGITIRFGGITFNLFINIYLFVASLNTLSFTTFTTLSNTHGDIIILKNDEHTLELVRRPVRVLIVRV